MENDFKTNLKKIEELHEKNPEVTEEAVNEAIDNIEYYLKSESINDKKNMPSFEKKEVLLAYVLGIIILLMGLYDGVDPLYYFGFVFFIAGYLVGTAGGPGIIFLFSHGVTGLCLMVIPKILAAYNNPIATESTHNINIYVGIIILLCIAATTKVILDSFATKETKPNKAIPLLLYTVAIAMAVVLNSIIPFIMSI